ncbi:hypothetical protein [Noviherbaspirillum sp. UKPF54]|uniref:hypothetical protein n=1 Tax=Noviherbaspirillum sp. UKPF54 TaxID=2601898 RepID=UPI001AF018C5|nr:hypothetical protein [Noviherbaspirillum sp. UKPF54]
MAEAVGDVVVVESVGAVVVVVVDDAGSVVVVVGVVVVVVDVVPRLRHDLDARVESCALLSLVVLPSPPPPHAESVRARRTGAR